MNCWTYTVKDPEGHLAFCPQDGGESAASILEHPGEKVLFLGCYPDVSLLLRNLRPLLQKKKLHQPFMVQSPGKPIPAHSAELQSLNFTKYVNVLVFFRL